MKYIDFSMYDVDGAEATWVSEFKRCQAWMEEALEYSYGTFNIMDVADLIAAQEAQLWSNDTAVAVTQPTIYPRKALVHLFLAGGDMDGVLKLEKQVVSWAKANRYHGIAMNGRFGWMRSPLRDIGYTVANVQMVKEI